MIETPLKFTAKSALCTVSAAVTFQPAAASENQFFSGVLDFADVLIPDKTHVTVGLGPILRPDYIGSNDYEVAVEPALYLRFEGIFTLENDGAAINLLGLGDFEFGPTARFTRGRNDNENTALSGLGDIGLSFDVGLYAKARIADTFTARVRYTHAIINNSNGGLLDFRLSTVLLRKQKLTLATALEADWITGGRAQRFFGITERQSEQSGNPVFSPNSSFRDVSLDMLAQLKISDKWSLNGFTSYSRLIGDPAKSPIVGQRGSPNQFTIGTYIAYRFSISTD